MIPATCDFHDGYRTCLHEATLYRLFDPDGHPVTPCGKKQCRTGSGVPYKPPPTTCANAMCGKRFRPVCPGMIYCSRECFEATHTGEHWNCVKPETKSERTKRLEKARKKRWFESDSGKKRRSEQNRRCYGARKSSGKVQEAYQKRKMMCLFTIKRQTGDTVSEKIATPDGEITVTRTDVAQSISIPSHSVGIANLEIPPEHPVVFPFSPPHEVSAIDSALSETSQTASEAIPNRTTKCRYPGCRERITLERPFWGRDQKFCCRQHRDTMMLLILRMERLFRIVGCAFLNRVVRYLRLITATPLP